MNDKIISAVDKCIEIICSDFKANPTLFFTENDLVCYFYKLLQENFPVKETLDKESRKHFLIHCEYPTPFKCDMEKDNFIIKPDDSRYKRGHYDIVILSPDFIRNESYSLIKAQTYSEYRSRVLREDRQYSPIVLYGVVSKTRRCPQLST